MRMLACCLLLAAIVSCEQPQPAPPPPQRPAKIVPAPKLDLRQQQREKTITDVQQEIRRLRSELEKHKEPSQ